MRESRGWCYVFLMHNVFWLWINEADYETYLVCDIRSVYLAVCVSLVLLGRGKAAKDFTGPDCRFLSFKKGETIYMYYKLSGQRSDMWAGSVSTQLMINLKLLVWLMIDLQWDLRHIILAMQTVCDDSQNTLIYWFSWAEDVCLKRWYS